MLEGGGEGERFSGGCLPSTVHLNIQTTAKDVDQTLSQGLMVWDMNLQSIEDSFIKPTPEFKCGQPGTTNEI